MYIYVDFYYHRKKDDEWVEGTKTFTNVERACRFIKLCKYKAGYILSGFRCDDHEDYEYLIMKGC